MPLPLMPDTPADAALAADAATPAACRCHHAAFTPLFALSDERACR